MQYIQGRPPTLENAATGIPPEIPVDGFRPVSIMFVIVMNKTSISSSEYDSISVNFLKQCVCGSFGAVGFELDRFFLCCFRIYL